MSLLAFPQTINEDTKASDILFGAEAEAKLDRLETLAARFEVNLNRLWTATVILQAAAEKVVAVDKSYSEREAAGALGVGVSTLQGIRYRGEIGASCVGGKWRYTPADIKEYLDRQHTKSR